MAKSVEELASQFEKMMQQFAGFQSMMQSSLDSLNAMGSWQVGADKAFADLRQQAEGTTSAMDAVSKRMDLATSRMDSLETRLKAMPTPGAQAQPSPAVRQVDLNVAPRTSSCSPAGDGERADGHGEHCGGVLGPRPQDKQKGTRPDPGSCQFGSPELVLPENLRSPPYPKMEFPKFDGSQPRFWRDCCEVFFEVYAVHPSLKTRFAVLNFQGPAATWLQTVQRHGRILEWEMLCDLVMAKFDKNQYQILLKQFEALRQKSSVGEYHAEFERLAHGILLYNNNYDDTYFVTRFVSGLKEEIRSVICLHQPKDVDTASALALIQEEELNNVRNKTGGKNWSKPVTEKVKPVEVEITKYKAEDKLSNLREFRRKNGLCFKCGEKWSHGHKCPAQVPLHVIEELLDALEDEGNDLDTVEDCDVQEVVLAVGHDSNSEIDKRRTMKICARIGKLDALILIDSGSVGTFISDKLASKLSLQSVPCSVAKFLAADGSPMVCTQKIEDLQWQAQGHTFTSTVGILPLQCFDMILGQDWLESCSPMWVHWSKKLMKFTYQGKRVSLQGITSELVKGSSVSSRKFQGLLNRQAHTHLIQLQFRCPDSKDSLEGVILSMQEGQYPEEVQQLLDTYQDVFQTPDALPPARPFDHKIQLLPGSQPVNIRPYRYSPVQKDEIEKQLKEMLSSGIIRPSTSPYASPVLLVKKKDGTWRFCVDYRHLNAQTVKNKHPLLVVDELIDELTGAQWFSKLDFRAGYHQICIDPGDTYKTAFKTHHGLFEFLVMPFGLTNAPATFQGIMNLIFAVLLRKGVLVFMDDILVYSKTLAEHVKLLQQVFEILRLHKFYIKLSKCSFAQGEVEYLGHIITGAGVSTEPTKIQAVQGWPTPKNLKELRGFLGLTGYYRRFIKNYGIISRPLSDLLTKNVPFVWTSVTEIAFQQLKDALSTSPVLAIPDFAKKFTLETDASDLGFGAVLMQEGHPVAYLSKAVCAKNQSLSTYEKECMAIILAVEKWRPYLQNQEFVIKTDHRSLLHLTEQRISTKLQQKALFKLMDLKFQIVYRAGSSNMAADALSRCHPSQTVLAVSSCQPDWVHRVKQGYLEDPVATKLLDQLADPEFVSRDFSVQDGLIRHQGRVWLGSNKLAHQHVLQAFHSSGIGGHSGFHATYYRVKQLFSWPGMKDDIAAFIKGCSTCQQAKVEHVRAPGMLQPLPIPTQAWQVVCMDFIEGLPKSQRYDSILVVVDKFTKYAHFVPLSHPYTALQVAQAYVDNIYKLHGLPKSIVSDRDRIFTSHVWRELFRLTDTQLMMSSSYHPQTDGQTERVN